MGTLTLNLKGEYFDQIVAGEKPFEFRLLNDYWKKRLVGRQYEFVEFCKGYPRKDDNKRRHVVKYTGYEIQTIKHKHFGQKPVKVFAIKTGGLL